ncbi:MAG: DUF72 domain-containing protein [Anaerolineales bacterium]|nr:DUF72 domain-containing protein [Anaerolineales bacterium]
MATAAQIHIGTSSWLFDAWRGVFYPERLPRPQYLTYYASQFDTVEVNTSFYGLPSPSTLVNWVESTPQGFTFALKFPKVISHEKRLSGCETESLAFLDALRALGNAAGPAFLQLPPDFTRREAGKTLANYLDWLAGRVVGLRIAVEVRAQDLMTPAFATYVAERGFALALVDRRDGPDLFDVWLALLEAGQGPDFAFIRWIGDDREGPQGDRELQLLRDTELDRWAVRCEDLAARGKQVYGYMHNPYEGHAPASVRRLMSRLAAGGRLADWSAPAGQLSLL